MDVPYYGKRHGLVHKPQWFSWKDRSLRPIVARQRADYDACHALSFFCIPELPRPQLMIRRLLTVMFALLPIVACNNTQEPLGGPSARVETDIPMTVAVVEDAALSDVIQRELTARLDVPVSVVQLTQEELLAGKRIEQDVVFYSPELIGELVARGWIDPLPSPVLESAEINPSDIAPRLYQQQVRWGDSIYALPLGTPVLTLMVRTDLLEALKIEVPETWEDYLSAVEKINSSAEVNGKEGQPTTATLEPFSESFLPDLWLAHCSSYVSRSGTFSTYFNYETAKAELDEAGFIRGTEELSQVYQSIPESLRGLTPTEVADQFLQGKSVMAITWLTTENRVPESMPGEIDFAPLPGSQTRYHVSDEAWQPRIQSREPISVPVLLGEGKIASISATSGRTLQAGEIVTLLTSAELAPLVSPASNKTGIYRTSSLPQVGSWLPKGLPGPAARRYAQTATQQLQSPVALSTLRIPHRQQYWDAARQSLRQMLDESDNDPKKTLGQLADRWDTLSEELGKEDQKQHFRQSIGIAH